MAYTSDQDKLFSSKLDDGAALCEKRHKAFFFSFFSEREQMLARRHLDSAGFHNYAFDGGYPDAERKILGLFYDEPETFPLCAIVFTFRRDGRCVIFVKSEIRDYITSQLFKVGSVGVKLDDAEPETLPKGRGYDEKDYTVSSLRLDAVVAAMTGLSREKTKSVILSGHVTHNYTDCQNISQRIGEKDIITVRGKGKYVINGVLGETKKHRIRISIIHFR